MRNSRILLSCCSLLFLGLVASCGHKNVVRLVKTAAPMVNPLVGEWKFEWGRGGSPVREYKKDTYLKIMDDSTAEFDDYTFDWHWKSKFRVTAFDTATQFKTLMFETYITQDTATHPVKGFNCKIENGRLSVNYDCDGCPQEIYGRVH